MVNSIGGGGAGKAAIEAALKRMNAHKGSMDKGADALANSEPEKATGSSFSNALKDGIATVEAKVERADSLYADALTGRMDIHEVAGALKESERTVQFALQVRNKLLDAYREVMRMSV